MTDPTREQMLDEGRKQARINGVVPLFADVYAAGWAAAMARADRAIEEAQRSADKSLWDANFSADLVYKGRIEELERQLRCVQLYGYGYLLNHGGKRIALDPKDVTVVLPSTRHMDDFDLHNSLHLTEQKLAAAYERIDELEEIVESSVLNDVFAERDDARQQVQVLQDRIAKAKTICADHADCDQAFGEISAVLDGTESDDEDEE